MVAIRRRTPALRKPPTASKNHKKSSSSSLIRTGILLIVVFLFVRTFIGLLSKATNNDAVITTTSNNNSANNKPMSVNEILNDSKQRVRGSGGTNTGEKVNNNNPNQNNNNNNNNNHLPDHKIPEEQYHRIYNNNNEGHVEHSSPKIILENKSNTGGSKPSSPDHNSENNSNNVNGHDDVLNSKQEPDSTEQEENRPPDHPNHEDDHPAIGDTITATTTKKRNTPGEPDPGKNPIHSIVLNKKGTGPTNVGYVKDFDDERQYPAFRKNSDTTKKYDASKEVATAVEEAAVKPCLVDANTKSIDPVCHDTDTTHIAYNPVAFKRSWCGTDIEPQTASMLSDGNGHHDHGGGQHCPMDSIVHVMDIQNPPIPTKGGNNNVEGIEPIIIQSHQEITLKDGDMETVECDIPCKQEIGLTSSPYNIHGESWEIAVPKGDDYANGAVKIERIDYRKDKYYATQSFASSIIRPFFDWDKHDVKSKSLPITNFDTAQSKAYYLVDKACSSWSTKRQKYFDAMKRFFPVDSYGKCQHSTNFPSDKDINKLEDRLQVMNQYKVVLAFDVSSDKDHISDYIWEAFLSGSVPVVVGADNIKEHLPTGSFVDSRSFGDWDEMAQYVVKMAKNKTEWESYHKWRKDESAYEALANKYEFARASWTCRLCRWAYSKKYGLGWDHYKQKVTPPKIDREHLCVSSSDNFKLVSKPFQEIWVVRRNDDSATSSIGDGATDGGECDSTIADTSIETDTFKLQRSIALHDGIIDIHLSNIEHLDSNSQVVFRMKFPGIQNSEGASFHNTHTLVPTSKYGESSTSSISLQDEFVKVTVLADWQTDLSSGGAEGIVDIVLLQAVTNEASHNIPRRIRIITEDTNELHDKMTEFFPSSFAKKMTIDFVDPLEIFYADS